MDPYWSSDPDECPFGCGYVTDFCHCDVDEFSAVNPYSTANYGRMSR